MDMHNDLNVITFSSAVETWGTLFSVASTWEATSMSHPLGAKYKHILTYSKYFVNSYAKICQ